MFPIETVGRSTGCEVPVLLVAFNRPDTTRAVFDAIRKARPVKLFISLDAPREQKPDDREKYEAVRKIIETVDWDCDVHYRLHEKNVGCRQNVAGGISWMFEHVEAGIILEDDCLPVPSFFRFCEVVLQRYADDERIMQICGNNYLGGKHELKESYYFSKILDVSGWATWKRAWRYFDDRMTGFERFDTENRIADYLEDKRMQKWTMSYLREAYASRGRGIWSPVWIYAMAVQNGLGVVPSVHLVSHMTFGRADSSCSSSDTWAEYNEVKTGEIKEMKHPPFILQDRVADKIRFDLIARTDPRLILSERIKTWLRWKVVEPVRCFAGRVAYVRRKLLGR
jgi:hypothetical protein